MSNISIEATAAIIGGLAGTLAAFLVNSLKESWRIWRRRRNIASALVYHFRLFRRHLVHNLKIAEEKNNIIFDAGYPDSFYVSILPELPDFGPELFLGVRSVFSQLRQINYLKKEMQHHMQAGTPAGKRINLIPAYIAAHKQAVCAIDTALEHLRSKAQRKTFCADLPEITELSELEKELLADVNSP
ncbi:MAG: hypothetical protein A2Y65_11495 [Deltaproteobacteria bacterium RBG_13_52_11]|nr:MAG: hypothetical protein A2Y65_11495 [Deltaproteobacteria bacterium RBG_13_52_11]